MIKTSRYSLSHWVLYLSAACALLCLYLRARGVFSFVEPRHVITSGYEEESLFAMWKFLYGQSIYTFPNDIPFAASYFNWLFYESYGSIIAFVMRTFHLHDWWIPTIGRALTLAIVALGAWLTTRLLMEQNSQKNISVPTAGSLSILLWASPLIGFWAITVRPDLLGLMFDIAAAYFLLRYIPKKPLVAVTLAALGCYLSWSCKQINIVMPMAIGLFLLWDRKIKLFAVFSSILISLYALTLWLAPEPMLKMIFFMDTAVPLSLDTLIHNLLQFVKKSGAVLFLFGWGLVNGVLSSKARQALFQHPLFRLGLCGLLAWCLTLLPASSKVGSAENYYFLLQFFMMFMVIPVLAQNLVSQKWQSFSLIGASMIFMVTIGMAMNTGFTAILNNQHAQNTELKQCLMTLKPPIFVMNHYGALPWMNPSPRPFVLAYNYWSDRQSGVSFEDNGIGGLIDKGFFNTLVLPKETINYFDSSELTDFERQANNCAQYAVYQKREHS